MQSGDVLTKYVTHKDHYYVSIVLSFSVSGQTVPTNRVLLANHHVSNIRQLRWSSVMLIVSPVGGASVRCAGDQDESQQLMLMTQKEHV